MELEIIKNVMVISLLSIQLSMAQIEKETGNFNKVTSFDKIDVTLIQADENKVIVNGSGANDVEIINKNGQLKIRMPLLKLLSGDNVSATVYFKNIDAIEANEGSRISSEGILEATSFDIIAKEGATIKVKLKCSRLTVKIASGAKVHLTGSAINQDVILGSGAVYEADNLSTTQTVITANAGAEADVFATELVDAKVRAGGNITIYGNPKQINKKIIAGGEIKKDNERVITKKEK